MNFSFILVFLLLNSTYSLEDLISGAGQAILCVGFHLVRDDNLDCSWLLLTMSVFMLSQV